MKEFKNGEVIFRQGDPGDCMYDIFSGRVGVYAAYGTPNEKLLTELKANEFFGEMGLLEKAPRSATIVALEDTLAYQISEADFDEYFMKQPAKALQIMRQLSQRLRQRTEDYVEACRAVHDALEEEKQGKPRSKKLMAKLNEIFDAYSEFEQLHGSMDASWFWY
jgi:CRP-like cAMP-binding protein